MRGKGKEEAKDGDCERQIDRQDIDKDGGSNTGAATQRQHHRGRCRQTDAGSSREILSRRSSRRLSSCIQTFDIPLSLTALPQLLLTYADVRPAISWFRVSGLELRLGV